MYLLLQLFIYGCLATVIVLLLNDKVGPATVVFVLAILLKIIYVTRKIK